MKYLETRDIYIGPFYLGEAEKHKTQVTFTYRDGRGSEEVLVFPGEGEMNDWIEAKVEQGIRWER